MWTYVAAGRRLQNVDWALRHEFLLTNGLGGYASSSILGCNTRRYHGLLVAAVNPPLDRRVLLAHLDELLLLPEGEQYLNTTEYRDGFYPDGYTRLRDFALDPLPTWRWQIGGLEITKRLVLVHGLDRVLLHYAATGDTEGARLALSPFAAMRSFHQLAGQREGLGVRPDADGPGFVVAADDGTVLCVRFSAGRAVTEPGWYSNVYHRREAERGLEEVEDLLRLGTVTVDLDRSEGVTVVATLGRPDEPSMDFEEAVGTELRRREALLLAAEPRDQREQALVVAADQFLVRRSRNQQDLVSVLAGYPWFADWGRDTMVALPGLCLATGRTDLARGVLRLWAGLVSEGMLPNRFEDDNRQLSYNSVDSALWFVQSAAATFRETSDRGFLRHVLWPAAAEIVNHYARGTRFNIHGDADGLLVAGTAESQLTWMDAKRGGRALTPRHGKAVEVNALWLSALCLVAEWAETLRAKPPEAVERRGEAAEAFRGLFWNPGAGCLYDCVNEHGVDATIRPNQLLAVSLPHAPVGGEQGRAVVGVCRRELLTPFGLRTVAPGDPTYHGRCVGGWGDRDEAYHQGTVWPWLLGPYVDALMATAEIPSAARDEAQRVIDTVLEALDEAALGTVSEIFDGDAPHVSRGCVAQAWSVAEILRVKRTHGL